MGVLSSLKLNAIVVRIILTLWKHEIQHKKLDIRKIRALDELVLEQHRAANFTFIIDSMTCHQLFCCASYTYM